MCGVCGIISFDDNGLNTEKLYGALLALIKRGPDFQNSKKLGFSVLGHARLSIIDLTPNSNQPMCFDDCGIVFNGEIYNYLEIRDELINKFDQKIETKGDTEIILRGYQIFGIDGLVSRLRGMFAFCILDNKKRVSYLVRDRFGEKPLFYSLKNGCLYFGSNLKSISEIVPKKNINKNAILELLGNQYISEEECIYEDIVKCPAGSIVEFKGDGVSTRSYWQPRYDNKIDMDFNESLEIVDDLLNKSIREQLAASDLPVNIFLSGGIDSSLIASIAKKYNPRIEGVTLGLSGNCDFDETNDAKMIAESLGMVTHIVNADYSSLLVNLESVLSYIEPFGDSSIIPTMMVAEKARNYSKVVLTGDGGDEMFGGYGKALMAKRSITQNNNLYWLLKYFGDRRLNPKFSKIGLFSQTGRVFEWGGVLGYLDNQDLMSSYLRKLILHPKWKQSDQKLEGAIHRSVFFDQKVEEPSDAILHWGIKCRLKDDYLMKVDSATMMFGIEARAPFLDHRINEFTSKLRIDSLMPNGVDKQITKRLLERYLEPHLIYKKKKGFSLPVTELFRGDWGVVLREYIRQGRSADLELLNPSGIMNLLEWNQRKDIPQLGRLLFSLLSLEIWLKKNYE